MVDHVLTVDADGHVLEPRDTWIDYIDPAYRDRAIRIAEDEQGLEVLLVDGQPLKSVRGSLAALLRFLNARRHFVTDCSPDECARRKCAN